MNLLNVILVLFFFQISSLLIARTQDSFIKTRATHIHSDHVLAKALHMTECRPDGAFVGCIRDTQDEAYFYAGP